MEGLEGIRGAEGGMEPEFHEIPSQGPSQTSQAEYIHAPSQGLPSTNDYNRVLDTPGKVNYVNQPALTISSIECRHSRHKQFRHKFFGSKKKFVCSHGDVFIRLSLQLQSPLAGAAALFVLSFYRAGKVLDDYLQFHW